MTSATDAATTAAETWDLLRDLLCNLDGLDPEGSGALQELIRSSGLRAGALRALRLLPTEGALPMRDLAGRLGCDRAYATHVVDELEARGYATRSVDPADRRSRVVEPTRSGRAVAEEARLLHERPPATLTGLSGTDLATLHRLLRRVEEGADGALEQAGLTSGRGLRGLRRRGLTLR